MNRLVLFVEGDGDVGSMPNLVTRLWAELPEELRVGFVDANPFRVGEAANLTTRNYEKWVRYLRAAVTRSNCTGVLLILDADTVEDARGCVRDVARALAEEAKKAGGGRQFSVGVVFIRQEFESLLIASYPLLSGRRADVALPTSVEEAPRGAKEWLNANLEGGYRASQDQLTLTRQIQFEHLRQLNLRSFRRLENALKELATAMATGRHIVSPGFPSGSGR